MNYAGPGYDPYMMSMMLGGGGAGAGVGGQGFMSNAWEWLGSPQAWMALTALSEGAMPNDPHLAPLNAFAKGQAKTESARRMFQSMLEGNEEVKINVSDNTFSSKGSLDNIGTALGAGVNLAAPRQPGPGYGGQTPYTGGSANKSNVIDKTPKPSSQEFQLLNPSPSPLGNLRLSDLAGLSPQEMLGIMQFKLQTDQLAGSQEVARANAATSRMNAIRENTKLLRASPLEVPGMGRITLDDWNALDTKTKAYSYYVYDAKRNGEMPMSYNEFTQQTAPGTMEQYFELAKEDSEFKKFLFEYAQKGATRISIGDKKEQAEAMADVKGKVYFTSPTGLTKDLESYINSEDVQNKIFRASTDGDDADLTRATIAVDFIKGRLAAAGHTILSVKQDGRAIVWKVKFKDGSTGEVRHAF